MTLFKSPNISYKLKIKLNFIKYFLYFKNRKKISDSFLQIRLLKKLLFRSFHTKLILNSMTVKYYRYIFRLSKSFTKFPKAIFVLLKDLFLKLQSYIKLLIGINFLKNFNGEQLKPFLKRLLYSFCIDFCPFVFLVKHSIIPGIYVLTSLSEFPSAYSRGLLVNEFVLKILGKIPYALTILKSILPALLSPNMESIQFCLIYLYFIIFRTKYRELKIPYEIAYHGTVAFAFLSLQYTLNLLQQFIAYPFDLYFVFVQYFSQISIDAKIGFSRDNLFSDLNNDIFLTYLSRVIQRFEFDKTILAKFILSPIAFVALCALVYNFLYYVLKKKNPRIFLISKTVSRLMGDFDGKDDLF